MLKRHEIQVLRRAGHAQVEVAALAGVSLGSVRRVLRFFTTFRVDGSPAKSIIIVEPSVSPSTVWLEAPQDWHCSCVLRGTWVKPPIS